MLSHRRTVQADKAACLYVIALTVEFLKGRRSGLLKLVPTIQIGPGCQRGSNYAIHNIMTRCGIGTNARKTSKSELLSGDLFSRQTTLLSLTEGESLAHRLTRIAGGDVPASFLVAALAFFTPRGDKARARTHA
jgi:hypothetical protein